MQAAITVLPTVGGLAVVIVACITFAEKLAAFVRWLSQLVPRRRRPRSARTYSSFRVRRASGQARPVAEVPRPYPDAVATSEYSRARLDNYRHVGLRARRSE